ncbi:glycosyltransferase family 2 protein [Microbacterium foliorum]|uniref:glycosyltransferase family 2 protein n=1 Tax=Microbacterium foliorum TaxID=104336 RepID=UPI001D64E165|nr:glycosyltransferase family 2 protein [Microbacterium foliorum]CAH0229549.1 N-acetylglucosaminyl-diphospho-decaprenol L-rhamnosyltransferase [Microbacterium foliorum]CAH0245257.1 N-acetylglucosaminyl-diphospho-decaprenol L-rhamnosyltransferase [Microbacterium foliorum]
MAVSPSFAVVTVNYGSSALIAENFGGLALPPQGHLIIVDSFSSTAEREAVRIVAGELGAECVLLDENLGYGGGTNAGAARALELGAEVIVPLNPDASIAIADLQTLVDAAHGTRDLVSPRIVTGAGATWFAGADLYLDDGTTAGRAARARHEGRPRREWATGACFALSADVWQRLGGLDEDYFLYWEDIDLSHRVLDAGGSLILSDAIVVHDEGGTHDGVASDRAKSSTYYYFNIRNRMLYARKHLNRSDVRRWRRSSLRVGYGILLQGGRRQLLSAAPWRAYARGIRDGYRVSRGKAEAR